MKGLHDLNSKLPYEYVERITPEVLRTFRGRYGDSGEGEGHLLDVWRTSKNSFGFWVHDGIAGTRKFYVIPLTENMSYMDQDDQMYPREDGPRFSTWAKKIRENIQTALNGSEAHYNQNDWTCWNVRNIEEDPDTLETYGPEFDVSKMLFIKDPTPPDQQIAECDQGNHADIDEEGHCTFCGEYIE